MSGGTPSWQIMPDPITANLLTASATHSDTGRSIGTGFSGRGILRPFRRDKKHDFANGSGAELVRSAVGLVLVTVCGSDSTQGELPWRTEFGSLIHQLRLRNNSPALGDLARSRIAAALGRWVPSVRLTLVQVFQKDDQLRLSITYDLIDPASSKVLVPGLETSVAVG